MNKIEKNISTIKSGLLAEYIGFKLSKVSHLKLQKILYYIEAFHLAYFDKSLIEDEFQAWVHGPVSRKIFDALKDKSLLYAELKYIPDNKNRDINKELTEKLTIEQKEIVDDVIENYGKLSGMELENLTHSETPWIEARGECAPEEKCDRIISKESMRVFYKNLLYGKNKI